MAAETGSFDEYLTAPIIQEIERAVN